MANLKAQQAGGRASAILQRTAAVALYEANPNICGTCGKPIPIDPNRPVHITKAKRFCNQSCAATTRNKYPDRRKPVTSKCQKCSIDLIPFRTPSGFWAKRKFCLECSKIARVHSSGPTLFFSSTKGALFARRGNWQSARSSIGRHARQVLESAGFPKHCKVCAYAKCVDACHIRGVMDFPDSATIAEINAVSNLVYLCKNHHWELDHQILSLDALC